jgi:hypothetical protein
MMIVLLVAPIFRASYRPQRRTAVRDKHAPFHGYAPIRRTELNTTWGQLRAQSDFRQAVATMSGVPKPVSGQTLPKWAIRATKIERMTPTCSRAILSVREANVSKVPQAVIA